MDRIVITGASGYIGRTLAKHLAKQGHSLRLVSRQVDQDRFDILPRNQVEHVAADLQQADSWKKLIVDAKAIVHLASRTDLRAAEKDPAGDELLNVLPIRALVCAMKQASPRKMAVVFASAATIVGVDHHNPVDEKTPDRPMSVYDRHKLACERSLEEATKLGLIQACSLRLSNVYGYGTESANANRGILNVMMKRAVRGEPITIFGDGRYIRDFIYLDDVLLAFGHAFENEQVRDGGHYVIAGGKGSTLADAFTLVAREAAEMIGRSVEIKHFPEPSDLHIIERRNFVGNSQLFSSKTGWFARTDLEVGIRRTLAEIIDSQNMSRILSV